MRRRLALAFALGLSLAAAGRPVTAAPQPVAITVSHPDGTTLSIASITFRPDSIVLAVTVSNTGDHAIRLDRARSLVLDDGAHGVYRFNPPPENPELRVPPHSRVHGDLVFVGPLAPATRRLTLSSNSGVGTTDNPFDTAPVLTATLPVDHPPAAAGRAVAVHPDGAAIAARPVAVGPRVCRLHLLATNGNERSIVLNRHQSLVLTDPKGDIAPLEAPTENRELVVPPGTRVDADLVFDCHGIDAAGGLTLVTNRGTAGTPDNPYDTLPVMRLKLAAAPAEAAPEAAASHTSVTPIARSRLAPPEPLMSKPLVPEPLTSGLPTSEPRAAAPQTTPSASPAVLPRRETPAAAVPPHPTPEPVIPEHPVPAHPAAPPPSGTKPVTSPPPPPTPTPTPTPEKLAPPPPPEKPQTPAELAAALHAKKTDRGMRLVIPVDLLFGWKQPSFSASAAPVMADVAALMRRMRRLREVVVRSNTDSQGTDAANLALSKERARVIVAWLNAHGPKPPPHFVAEGFGRTRPVAPNHKADGSDNPAGRAKNRRIEILLRRR